MAKALYEVYPHTNTGETLFDGKYSVWKIDDEGGPNVKAAYIVKSARAQWVLFRNMNAPELMYVMTVPRAGFPRVADIRGVKWFRDMGDGVLETVY